MIKYAKIVNETTKECQVGVGTNYKFYQSIGMVEMDVEQAYNGAWYAAGYAPARPEPAYTEKRAAQYPSFADQLDMMYWDRVNGTNVWAETVAAVKANYPKPQTEEEV